MGCPNFFKYHPNATIEDYSERFGYDAEVLKQTLMQTDSYRKRKEVNREISEDNILIKILFDTDRKGLTDLLYDQQKNTDEYGQQNLSHSYLDMFKSIDFRRIIDLYLDDEDNKNDKSYELYPNENPYKFMLEIIGMLNNGYSINEIIKNIEENSPESEVSSKIFEMVNLLNVLTNKKLCPICGNLIDPNENNELDFCILCGNMIDKKNLVPIRIEPRKENLVLDKLQLSLV